MCTRVLPDRGSGTGSIQSDSLPTAPPRSTRKPPSRWLTDRPSSAPAQNRASARASVASMHRALNRAVVMGAIIPVPPDRKPATVSCGRMA